MPLLWSHEDLMLEFRIAEDDSAASVIAGLDASRT
jgi:hypothetical protein